MELSKAHGMLFSPCDFLHDLILVTFEFPLRPESLTSVTTYTICPLEFRVYVFFFHLPTSNRSRFHYLRVIAVDGRNLAPVEVGSLSHLQGFIYPRWLFGISEPSTVVIPSAFLLLPPHLLGGFIHIFVNSLVASTSTKGTRGTALVVAPEISSGFIWGGLMHGADWLPTIVEGVAGIRTTVG